MPEKAPDFRIMSRAYREWEHHVVPFRVDEIVDAVLSLPPEERREVEWPVRGHPHDFVIPSVHVFGLEFAISAEKDLDGRWKRVYQVKWLPPL